MAAEDIVSADDYISEDSSFYGSEGEQKRQQGLCDAFDPSLYWRTRGKDVERAKTETNTSKGSSLDLDQLEDGITVPVCAMAAKHSDIALLDRKVMKQDRLARLGKRQRVPSPEPPARLELFNRLEGHADAWQLGESVENFVRRLNPTSLSVLSHHWIWVANPHYDPCEKSTTPDTLEFSERGNEFLEESLGHRQSIQAQCSRKSKAVLNRELRQESAALQQHITKLAVKTHVLSGKWMLFPKSADVERIWKTIAQGVIDNRLGTIAKVATDNGSAERLICVYTKDFRDVNDIVRVLKELDTMGLVSSGGGRCIYYKSDAYTHLELKSDTAKQFGLQASLYSSNSILTAAQLPSVRPKSDHKHASLKKFF
ncbi:hypothetical protein ACN47E_004561 [Coniothyrium glycines]